MSQGAYNLAVCRSADSKLQLWAIADSPTPAKVLSTRWKKSAAAGVGWTDWEGQPLPKVGDVTPFAYDVFAAQTAKAKTLEPALGRMQLWVTCQGSIPIFTSIKSSEQPNAQWGPWIPFPKPPPFLGPTPVGPNFVAQDGTVVPLPDGRLQVWLWVGDASTTGELWSIVQLSAGPAADPSSNWSPWKQFPIFPQGEQLPVWAEPSMAACQLPDGTTQLWAVGPGQGSSPGVDRRVYTRIRAKASGNVSDPLSGWSAPSLFGVPPPQNLPPVAINQAYELRAAADAQGRAYLWVQLITLQPDGAFPGFPPTWVYTYSSPRGSPITWNPLVNFQPPPIQLSEIDRDAAVAVLPEGALQFFYSSSNHIWTAWQKPGQSPTSWTAWEDVSIP